MDVPWRLASTTAVLVERYGYDPEDACALAIWAAFDPHEHAHDLDAHEADLDLFLLGMKLFSRV